MKWIPISQAIVGVVYSGRRMRDPLCSYEAPGDCFLNDDGKWYRIEPPTELAGNCTHVLFKPEDDA